MILKKNALKEKSYSFALEIVKTYKILSENREFIMSKQLLRCGTSIGANIAEANGAISEAEFSSKISIAYKEALETKYWLSLLHDSHYLDSKLFDNLFEKADEICRICFSVLKSTRMNHNK